MFGNGPRPRGCPERPERKAGSAQPRLRPSCQQLTCNVNVGGECGRLWESHRDPLSSRTRPQHICQLRALRSFEFRNKSALALEGARTQGPGRRRGESAVQGGPASSAGAPVPGPCAGLRDCLMPFKEAPPAGVAGSSSHTWNPSRLSGRLGGELKIPAAAGERAVCRASLPPCPPVFAGAPTQTAPQVKFWFPERRSARRAPLRPLPVVKAPAVGLRLPQAPGSRPAGHCHFQVGRTGQCPGSGPVRRGQVPTVTAPQRPLTGCPCLSEPAQEAGFR